MSLESIRRVTVGFIGAFLASVDPRPLHSTECSCCFSDTKLFPSLDRGRTTLLREGNEMMTDPAKQVLSGA